jgi:hypothetical protein
VRAVVKIQQKIRPWWRADEKGQVMVFVRTGWKPLEFEKGKAGVSSRTMNKLPGISNTLIEVVRTSALEPMLDPGGGSFQRRSRRWTLFTD